MNINFQGNLSKNGLKGRCDAPRVFFLRRPIQGRQEWSLRARTDGCLALPIQRQILGLYLLPISLLSIETLPLCDDELLSAHELLIHPIRDMLHTTGFLYEAWIIVYAVSLLVATFNSEWRRVQKKFQQWLSASAITFVIGTVGFEMIGGAYFESVNRKGM